MTVAVSNTNLNDSFNTWRLNTNLAATILSNNVVTVSRAGSANRGGAAKGNGHVSGTFSATNLRTSTIKGGNTTSGTGGALTVSSNTTFNGSQVTVSANATFSGNVTFQTAGTDRINMGDVSRIIISGGTPGQFMRLAGSTDNPDWKSLTLRDITDLSSNAAPIILSAANTTFSDNGDTPHLIFAANNGADKVEIYLASNSSASTDSDLIVQLAGTSANASISIVNSSNTEVASIRADGTIFATSNVTATGITTDGHILPIGDDARDLGAPNREFRNLYIDGTAQVDILEVATGASQGVNSSLIPQPNGTRNLGSTTRKWSTLWAQNTNGGAGVFNTLGVSGAFTANGTATFNGGFSLNGDVNIGDASSDTLTITAQIDSDFDPQTGTQRSMGATNNRWHEVYANTVYANTINVDNNTTINGDLTVNGTTSVASGQTFSSPVGRFTNVHATTLAEFFGTTIIGNDASDNVTITAQIASDLIPDADDTYDLGTNLLQWQDLYIDGTASIDILTVDEAATLGGDRATISGNAHVTGTAFIGGGIKDGATTIIGANAKLHANNTISAKTVTTTMIANTMTSSGNFGSASQIPIINVNDRGQVTGISETTVDVVTGITYTSANNNIRISTADGSTFDDVIDPATTSVKGVASFDSGDFDVSSGAVSLKNATTGAVLAISATANETTVSRSNGTVTVGLPDDVTVAGQLNVGENVVVSGNLIVSGTTTTVNTETVNIADNIIVLNSNHSGSPTQDGGISIERGSSADKTLIWDEGNDRWTVGSETFVAGTFLGDLSGSATTLATARTIGMTGDVVWTSAAFDGSGNVTGTATIQPNSVALGTDTTGNYVASLTPGNLIDVSGNSGESATPTIDVDLSELTTSTSNGDGDFFVVVDSSNAQKKLTKGNIAISGFNTTNGIALGTDTTGNYIAAVSAGNGIDVSGSGEGATATISIESDLRGEVTKIGADTNDFYDITSTTHDWYLDGVLDMRLENDGDLHVDGDLVSHSTTTNSDRKLKTDINNVDNALEKVEKLNGVEFTWIKSGKRSAGVIAQDVLEVLPQAVKEVNDLNTDEKNLTVNYDSLHALLIEAVKELSAKVKELESK